MEASLAHLDSKQGSPPSPIHGATNLQPDLCPCARRWIPMAYQPYVPHAPPLLPGTGVPPMEPSFSLFLAAGAGVPLEQADASLGMRPHQTWCPFVAGRAPPAIFPKLQPLLPWAPAAEASSAEFPWSRRSQQEPFLPWPRRPQPATIFPKCWRTGAMSPLSRKCRARAHPSAPAMDTGAPSSSPWPPDPQSRAAPLLLLPSSNVDRRHGAEPEPPL